MTARSAFGDRLGAAVKRNMPDSPPAGEREAPRPPPSCLMLHSRGNSSSPINGRAPFGFKLVKNGTATSATIVRLIGGAMARHSTQSRGTGDGLDSSPEDAPPNGCRTAASRATAARIDYDVNDPSPKPRHSRAIERLALNEALTIALVCLTIPAASIDRSAPGAQTSDLPRKIVRTVTDRAERGYAPAKVGFLSPGPPTAHHHRD